VKEEVEERISKERRRDIVGSRKEKA